MFPRSHAAGGRRALFITPLLLAALASPAARPSALTLQVPTPLTPEAAQRSTLNAQRSVPGPERLALAPPLMLMDGPDPVTAEAGHAAPAVLDVDGDGRKDLLVGQYAGGKVRVYRNHGRPEAPVYCGWSFLEAAEQEARVPYG